MKRARFLVDEFGGPLELRKVHVGHIEFPTSIIEEKESKKDSIESLAAISSNLENDKE